MIRRRIRPMCVTAMMGLLATPICSSLASEPVDDIGKILQEAREAQKLLKSDSAADVIAKQEAANKLRLAALRISEGNALQHLFLSFYYDYKKDHQEMCRQLIVAHQLSCGTNSDPQEYPNLLTRVEAEIAGLCDLPAPRERVPGWARLSWKNVLANASPGVPFITVDNLRVQRCSVSYLTTGQHNTIVALGTRTRKGQITLKEIDNDANALLPPFSESHPDEDKAHPDKAHPTDSGDGRNEAALPLFGFEVGLALSYMYAPLHKGSVLLDGSTEVRADANGTTSGKLCESATCVYAGTANVEQHLVGLSVSLPVQLRVHPSVSLHLDPTVALGFGVGSSAVSWGIGGWVGPEFLLGAVRLQAGAAGYWEQLSFDFAAKGERFVRPQLGDGVTALEDSTLRVNQALGGPMLGLGVRAGSSFTIGARAEILFSENDNVAARATFGAVYSLR